MIDILCTGIYAYCSYIQCLGDLYTASHVHIRCIDYVQISRRGGQFGFTENCGSAVLPENRLQLDSGTRACLLACLYIYTTLYVILHEYTCGKHWNDMQSNCVSYCMNIHVENIGMTCMESTLCVILHVENIGMSCSQIVCHTA